MEDAAVMGNAADGRCGGDGKCRRQKDAAEKEDSMKNDRLWAVSLLVIAAVTLCFFGTRIMSVGLPDWLCRVMGLIDIAALPVFTYATVRKFWLKK